MDSLSFYGNRGTVKTEVKVEYRDVVVSETPPTDKTKLWVDTSK